MSDLNNSSSNSISYIPQLTTSNFDSWSSLVTTEITGKGWGRWLNGTAKEPKQKEKEDEDDFDKRVDTFEKNHGSIITLFNRTMDHPNRLLIQGVLRADKAFEIIKKHHGQTRVATVMTLLFQYFRMDLEEGGDIYAHVSNMREMYSRLSSLSTTISSSPGSNLLESTIPSASAINVTLPDQVVAGIILKSLPPSFKPLVDTFFNGEFKDLTSQKVYERLQNAIALKDEISTTGFSGEAKRLKQSAGNSGGGSGSGGAGKDGNGKGDKPKCTYVPCGKVGHTEDKCFKKQGDQLSALVSSGAVVKGTDGTLSAAKSVPAHSATLSSVDHLPIPSSSDELEFIDGPVSLFFAAEVTTSSVYSFLTHPDSSIIAILDSGAGDHLWSTKSGLQNLRSIPPVQVTLANGHKCLAVVAGDFVISNEKGSFALSRVLYCPGITHNLVSVSRITSSGKFQVLFDMIDSESHDGRIVKKNSSLVVARAPLLGSLFVFKVRPTPSLIIAAVAKSSSTTLSAWHDRLGHLNFRDLRLLLKTPLFKGVVVEDSENDPFCASCAMGKHHALPSYPSTTTSANPLDLIHSDVAGPMSTPSREGQLYWVTFIDDFSRRPFVYFLRQKSQVSLAFKHFKALVENQTGRKIKAIRTDGGGEYLNAEIRTITLAEGIIHETTNPDCSFQNGISERFNRTLAEKVVTQLHQSGLPKSFWADAAALATQLLALSPNSSLKGTSPLKLWPRDTGIPDVSRLHPFGCAAYPLITKNHRKKLEFHSTPCVFLGFYEGTKGFKLWDIEGKRIRKSPHVLFDDNLFPYRQASTALLKRPTADVDEEEFFDAEEGDEPVAKKDFVAPAEEKLAEPLNNEDDDDNNENEDEDDPQSPRPKRGERIDYAKLHRGNLAQISLAEKTRCSALSAATVTSIINETVGSDDNYLRDLLNQPLAIDALGALLDDSPTLREAKLSSNWPQWKVAIDEELQSIQDMKTWDLVPRPSKGINVLRTFFVLKQKRGPTGEIERFKAREVVDGGGQKFGNDYDEVFAAVGKAVTLRVCHAVRARLNLFCEQFDVCVAFLGATVDKIIYVEAPPDFEFPEGMNRANTVCKLNKSLYGLKQSPRLWRIRITTELKKVGLIMSKSDDGLFILREGDEFLFLFLYVDDGKLFSNSKRLIAKLRRHLESVFKLRWDTNPSYFLGVVDHHDVQRGLVTLSQEAYAKSILARFGMENCNPARTPIAVNSTLTPGTPAELESGKDLPLGALIGCLLYLSCWSRPDIMAATSRIAPFVTKSTPAAFEAAKHILRYIKGTLDYGITYTRDLDPLQHEAQFSTGPPSTPPKLQSDLLNLTVYSDSGYGGCLVSRRSTTGNTTLLSNGVVYWTSRRQATVATSTVQAEYQAMAETGGQINFLRSLLGEMGFPQESATLLYGDNQGAIALANSTIGTRSTMNMDIKFHYIRELLDRKVVELAYISTKDMLADIMTKGLPRVLHQRLSSALGIGPVGSITRGGVLEVDSSES